MGSDFYDDDLIRQRDRAERIKMGPGDELPSRDSSSDEGIGKPVSDFNLTRMARHKQDVDSQASRAMQELEMLRKRQEQLEIEKRDLEEFRRKSEEFERGKRDMMAGIRRSLAAIERDELDGQRLLELLEATRNRFKGLLGDLEGIEERGWNESNIREELARALGIIEDARVEYNKSMAKVDAIKSGQAATKGEPSLSSVMFDDGNARDLGEKSFVYWVKVGAAFSLPLVVTLLVIALVQMLMTLSGYW